MPRACNDSGNGPISEIAIVDTFTKLIFGGEVAYSASELSIIQALRLVDANVLIDGHDDMGDYLRAMGVREMIQLVSQVREQLLRGLPTIPLSSGAVYARDAGLGAVRGRPFQRN